MIISVWYTRDFIEKILTPNLSFQKLEWKSGKGTTMNSKTDIWTTRSVCHCLLGWLQSLWSTVGERFHQQSQLVNKTINEAGRDQ